MRFFNTAGPCEANSHYMVPPLERLPEAPLFVERNQFFAVHGKTPTTMTSSTSVTSGSWRGTFLSACPAPSTAK